MYFCIVKLYLLINNSKMKKFYLFAMLLSLFGVTQLKAETLTENFDAVTVNSDYKTLSNGWFVQGSGYVYSTPDTYQYGIGSESDYKAYGNTGKALYSMYGSSAHTNYIIVPTKLVGTLTFNYRACCGSRVSYTPFVEIYKVTESGGTYTVGTKIQTLNPTKGGAWAEASVDLGTDGTMVAIRLFRSYIDNFSAEIYEEAAAGTTITVYEDAAATTKVTSDAYDYGFLAEAGTKTFYVKNDGDAARTYNFSVPAGYSADASLTVAAGETAEYVVTQTYGEGDYGFKSGALTVSSDDMDDVVINLKGIARDPSKIYLDFSEEPEGWTLEGNWTVTDGVADKGYSNANIISPMIDVQEGDKLYFRYTKTSSSAYYGVLTVWYSTDNENWTQLSADINLVYGTWNEVIVDLPANAKYIAINGSYIQVDDIYGLTLSQSAHMTLDATDLALGMINAEQVNTLTVGNDGKSDLTNLAVASTNANITAAVDNTTVAPGETATLTITTGIAALGLQEATITVTADDQDAASFNVSAYVCDPEQMLADFNDNKLPAGWNTDGWTFANGAAYSNTDKYLTLPAVVVNEGEELVFMAKGNNSMAELRLEQSTDGGATWNQIASFDSNLNTSDYTLITYSEIAAGDALLRFKGYAVYVDAIAGYHVNDNAPAMKVTADEADLAASYDFGRVKESVSKTFTVENTGAGTLNVNIASSTEDFTVSETTLEVASGETATFDVTLVFDENYGEKTAEITVTPTNAGLEAVAFTVTAETADPNVWDEDFEGQAIPAGWQTTGWTVNNQSFYAGNGTYMAYSGTSVADLITPRLEAAEGDKLTFEAGVPYDDEPLSIYYKEENDEDWTLLGEYTESGTVEFTAPAAGFYNLKMTGRYVKVDNFYGLKLALKDHELVINTFNIPTEGEQYAEYTATVTLDELVGKDETATATLYVNGEAVATDEVFVASNGSATATLTYTPEEAVEDATAYIEVSYAEENTLKTDEVTITIAPAYTINDNETISPTYGNYAAIIVNYNGKAGWNTITLPFEVSDLSVFGEGAKAYEFTGMNGQSLSFDVVTTIEAATPYVLYLPEAITEPLVFTNVEVPYYAQNPYTVTKDGASFVPTYAPIAAPDMKGLYGVVPSTGKIAKGSDKASLRALRGYFQMPEGASANEYGALFNDGGEVTAISAATIFDTNDGEVYDLSGRKMNSGKALQPGVYVKNGKKYVVK